MAVNLIVAVNGDFAIGNSKSNDLLYKLEGDLKRFRKLTMGNYVVMGSKTWKSLPNPLKGRTNVVLSRSSNYELISNDNYELIYHNNLENVITQYKESGKQEKELFIIGGAEIYAQAFPYVDKVYLTLINHNNHPEGDVYFPMEELDEFIPIDYEEKLDEVTGLQYKFISLIRNEE